MQTFEIFAQAQQAAEDGEDLMVSGVVMPDGKPVYFVLPRSASDEEVRDAAFEARNGRPMQQHERTLLQLAEARKAKTDGS